MAKTMTSARLANFEKALKHLEKEKITWTQAAQFLIDAINKYKGIPPYLKKGKE